MLTISCWINVFRKVRNGDLKPRLNVAHNGLIGVSGQEGNS